MTTPRREWQIVGLHCEEGTSNKFYAIRIDLIDGRYVVIASNGPANAISGREQACHKKGTHSNLYSAQQEVERLANEKKRKGYVNVDSPGYRGGVTIQRIISMIDSSRIVGYSEAIPPTIPPIPANPAGTAGHSRTTRRTTAPETQEPTVPGPIRARRQINF